MSLFNYLADHWPPTIGKKLIKSPSVGGNRSNFWTQYLEYRIQKWCADNKYFWLRELECNKPRKKLDYAIVKQDPSMDYFSGKDLDWHVLIEAEWDQGKYKKFRKGDFTKLVKYPSSNNRQAKIVIINTAGGRRGWKATHEKIKKELENKARRDKCHYFVLMTCYYSYKKTKHVGYSIYDNWSKRPRKQRVFKENVGFLKDNEHS